MQYRLECISEKTYAQWFADHCAHLEHRSPFHHPAWLKASAEGVGFENVYVGLFEGRELAGVLPGHLGRRGPLRFFGSPLRGAMTSYLGPVGFGLNGRPEQMVELIMQCNDFVRRQWRAQYARFTLRNAPAEGKLPLPPNWRQQRPGSYRLDLSPGEEGVWKGLKSDCRRNIRKARKSGIEIAILRDPGLFFQMLEETFRRHQSSSFHSERFFRLLLEEVAAADRLWPWAAQYKGQTVAAGLFLHDAHEVHFVSGASWPEFGNLPTSYLLHWHAIEAGIRDGLRVFNSDASRIRSVDRFKESFRPTLERRYTLIWAPATIYRAQKNFIAAYRLLRRLRARLRPAASQPGSET